jgi:hypothetical protein
MCGGGEGLIRVKAHVQGFVPLKAEPPAGSLKHIRGHAQIQEDAGRRLAAGFFQDLPQAGVRTMKQRKMGGEGGQPGGCRLQDRGITIKSPELPHSSDSCQDGHGMSPLA